MDRILGIALPARPSQEGPAPLPRALRTAPWIVRVLVAWQRRADERQRMERMSDADLSDVGLTRRDLGLSGRPLHDPFF